MCCRQGQATKRKRFKFVTLNIYCFYTFKKHSRMPKRKCVKSYRLLQNRNSVTRFKQVENRSRNHALRKRTRQCIQEKRKCICFVSIDLFCVHTATLSLTGVRTPSHLIVSHEHFLLAMCLHGSLTCYVY